MKLGDYTVREIAQECKKHDEEPYYCSQDCIFYNQYYAICTLSNIFKANRF